MIDILSAAERKWVWLLKEIGVDGAIFTGKHQPCIYCDGRDRARWHKQKEIFICNQCGTLQPIDIAMRHLGLSFKETSFKLKKLLDFAVETPIEKPDYAKNEANIKKIFSKCKRIRADSPVDKYLKNRGIIMRPEQDLYQHSDAPYWEEGKLKGRYPAMVAVFRTADGKVSTLHLTFLDESGNKADVPTTRKMMPVMNKFTGSACRMWKDGAILCIAEGIETALAVQQINGYPVWSVGSASNMKAFEPPDIVKNIYIYVDEDISATGVLAGYTLQNRLKLSKKLEQVVVVRLFDGKPQYDYGGFDFGARNYDWNDYSRDHHE